MEWILYIGGGVVVLAVIAWFALRKSRKAKDGDIYPLW